MKYWALAVVGLMWALVACLPPVPTTTPPPVTLVAPPSVTLVAPPSVTVPSGKPKGETPSVTREPSATRWPLTPTPPDLKTVPPTAEVATPPASVVDGPSFPPVTGGVPAEDSPLVGMLTLLISLVAGGLVSSALEQWTWWKEWKPGNDRVKLMVVGLLTIGAGALLVWTKDFLLPNYWVSVPEEVQTFLLGLATFVMSQYWHNNR